MAAIGAAVGTGATATHAAGDHPAYSNAVKDS
jgi:hypothetical protein